MWYVVCRQQPIQKWLLVARWLEAIISNHKLWSASNFSPRRHFFFSTDFILRETFEFVRNLIIQLPRVVLTRTGQFIPFGLCLCNIWQHHEQTPIVTTSCAQILIKFHSVSLHYFYFFLNLLFFFFDASVIFVLPKINLFIYFVEKIIIHTFSVPSELFW